MSASVVQMNRQEFLTAFSDVFEHSPWIAEAVWRRGLDTGHDSAGGLLDAFAQVIKSATREHKLALLNAHPDLAVATEERVKLTDASQSEQQGAGLDCCTPAEFAEFQDLNSRYRSTFGFPFIMAVKGFDRHQILREFRTRSEHDYETEFTTAVEQVIRIGGIRIAARIEELE